MNIVGLTKTEVQERINNNLVNEDTTPKTKSVGEIIKYNLFNYFNFINVILGSSIILAGVFSGRIFYSIKNCLFMGVIIVNTIISVVQELISKKIIDRLSLLSVAKINVLRDSKIESININEIVIDDVIKLFPGNQVPVDIIVLDGDCEINESFLTGEVEPVNKKVGDEVLSGSFVVSGVVFGKVIHIKEDNYVSKISCEAKYLKNVHSEIMSSFTKLLKVLSILIVPIAVVLYFTQLKANDYMISDAVFATVAALIGMIPEGLILLTSSVMAVSVIRLSKYKVLVQQLYCIETFARVDMICLDKTGTLTKGEMKLNEVINVKLNEKQISDILNSIIFYSQDNNETFKAIKQKYPGEKRFDLIKQIPFSSSRKYSVTSLSDGYTYYLGAPEIILGANFNLIDEAIKNKQKDYRLLVLTRSKKYSVKPKASTLLCYLLIEDVLRLEAKDTLNYFKEQNVNIKIISGDNINTVLQIANKLELTDLKGIDTSNLSEEDLKSIVNDYNVFGRVKPNQKKYIVEALKTNGYTVAMTGDGVNDVLALKESDCAIAMASGSDAARNVAQIVLLNNNFDALPHVVSEGRRTINNLERSSSLMLVKTIYTMLLILFCITTSSKYFFLPIQLTLITFFTMAFPSFVLALEPNNNIIKGNFMLNVISKSIPAALIVVFNIIMVTFFRNLFDFSSDLSSFLFVSLTGMTGFIFLYRLCTPFNGLRKLLYGFLILGFSYCVLFQYKFFNISTITFRTILIYIILSICSLFLFDKLIRITNYLFRKLKAKINK